MTFDEKIYRIACSFPTLRRKGVADGNIPGIKPDDFCERKLYTFLHRGSAGAWSSGEILVLEFLLNLFAPDIYDRFNFGRALNVWDDEHVNCCLKGVAMIFDPRWQQRR